MELDQYQNQMHFTVSGKSVIDFKLIDLPYYLRNAFYWEIETATKQFFEENGFYFSEGITQLKVGNRESFIELFQDSKDCVIHLKVKSQFFDFLKEGGSLQNQHFFLRDNDQWEQKNEKYNTNGHFEENGRILYTFHLPVKRLFEEKLKKEIRIQERPLFLFLQPQNKISNNLIFDTQKWSYTDQNFFVSQQPLRFSAHHHFLKYTTFEDKETQQVYKNFQLSGTQGFFSWNNQLGLVYPIYL
ncbi:hypothetical protein [Flammeovirga pacifica]|uniref:Uncharacterized protein n=1 Tax=Flammeovirga pacifica TaxID=915059 RepID=A0A1S1YVD2_FLAPC|nr:hypothetical protein [Flammeovirga pacifica]OHX64960.1 hypothetical protein NH26_00655 [Flammeovirga pacifica]